MSEPTLMLREWLRAIAQVVGFAGVVFSVFIGIPIAVNYPPALLLIPVAVCLSMMLATWGGLGWR